MNEIIREFQQATSYFIEAVTRFPNDKREEKLFDEWNIKDVIAHYTGWNIYFTKALKALHEGREPKFWDNINKFNEKEVSKRNDWSWDKVYKEFLKSIDKFIEEYQSLPTELWEQSFWQTRNHTPKKFLEINTHHYHKGHFSKIKDYLSN